MGTKKVYHQCRQRSTLLYVLFVVVISYRELWPKKRSICTFAEAFVTMGGHHQYRCINLQYTFTSISVWLSLLEVNLLVLVPRTGNCSTACYSTCRSHSLLPNTEATERSPKKTGNITVCVLESTCVGVLVLVPSWSPERVLYHLLYKCRYLPGECIRSSEKIFPTWDPPAFHSAITYEGLATWPHSLMCCICCIYR